jgi:uncharacterized protein
MTFSEQAVVFDCQGCALLGVLHRPDSQAELGVVVVVGGPQYRAGSHRQFVQLGRALAANGLACLRFDVRGMGDSAGAARGFDALDDDISAAIDTLLQEVPSLKGVVLWGLCDGASAALMHVQRVADTRVRGLALLNPWVRSEATLARTHVKHYYWQRLQEGAFWRKVFSGQVALKAASDLWRTLLLSMRGAKGPAGGTAMPYQDRMAAGWSAFKGPLLVLISDDDLTAQEFIGASQSQPVWQAALAAVPGQWVHLPGADHTCSRPGNGLACEQATLKWLDQVQAGAQTRR